MNKKKYRWLLPAAALAGLLLVVAWMAGLFSDRIDPGLATRGTQDPGQAVAVQREEHTLEESVPASVEAREATLVSARLLARITSIEVRAGDVVSRDQLLVRLEDRDLQAQAEQAREHSRALEARLAEARQNRSRAEELHRRGLIAAADRDAARANALSLEAELASARQALVAAEAALGFAAIRSPIDGRVVDRFAEPGDTASPGSKLLSLYNPGSLWVEARVREQLALALTPGQALPVDIPATGQQLQARIEEIVPAADPGSRSFLVKAALPANGKLQPGMYARLRVPAGRHASLLVDAARIAQVGQLDVVWVLAAGGPQRRFVRLGPATDDGRIEVLAGLAEGELVLPVP